MDENPEEEVVIEKLVKEEEAVVDAAAMGFWVFHNQPLG